MSDCQIIQTKRTMGKSMMVQQILHQMKEQGVKSPNTVVISPTLVFIDDMKDGKLPRNAFYDQCLKRNAFYDQCLKL